MKNLLLIPLLLWSQHGNAGLVRKQDEDVFIYKIPSSLTNGTAQSYSNKTTGLYYSNEIQIGSEKSMAETLRNLLKQSYGIDSNTAYASTQTISYRRDGISHFNHCYDDYKWKTAHFKGGSCRIEVFNEKLTGPAYWHCDAEGSHKVSTSHSTKFSSTHGWKITAKTDQVTSTVIGLEISAEVSGSYTQEYVDQENEEHNWTFEKGYIYSPFTADAYLVCSGEYLEDETSFNTDGFTYYGQTGNYHDLSDHDDKMCRTAWGKQSRNDNGGSCTYDTNAYKCTHPEHGVLYQYKGKRWENIKLDTSWTKAEDVTIPLLDHKNRGMSILGYKRQACGST